jgi:hypothetical protein
MEGRENSVSFDHRANLGGLEDAMGEGSDRSKFRKKKVTGNWIVVRESALFYS